jgi:hypothetical protein
MVVATLGPSIGAKIVSGESTVLLSITTVIGLCLGWLYVSKHSLLGKVEGFRRRYLISAILINGSLLSSHLVPGGDHDVLSEYELAVGLYLLVPSSVLMLYLLLYSGPAKQARRMFCNKYT